MLPRVERADVYVIFQRVTAFSYLIMPPIRGKRDPELDCLTRAKICELHTTNGWGATTIKKMRFPDIPRSII
jgi:hypothetical protein